MKICSGRIITLLYIVIILIACRNGEENTASSVNDIVEILEEQDNVSEEIVIPKMSEPSIPGDLDTDKARDLGKILTASWTVRNPERRIDREVSWGIIKIQRQHFIIFDFLVSKPLLIWGASEGGSTPIDQVVGRIVGMEIEDNSIWLYYRRITSWSPFETNPETGTNWFTDYEPTEGETLGDEIWSFHVWYNEDSDTLSVDPETMIAGRQYSKDSRLERTSERL